MTSRASLHPFWIIAGVLLVTSTLRGTFTGAGPLLGDIGQAFDLGASQAGFLITLPLLAFFVVSPFAARLARAAGLERAIFLALIAMIVGIAIRSAGPLWALYLGSTALGAGIAIGNTLLPSLLKRDFCDWSPARRRRRMGAGLGGVWRLVHPVGRAGAGRGA